MYDIERERRIIEILEQKGTIGVNRLAELVFTSGSTIRRDLNKLEKKGLIKRTFGAVSIVTHSNAEETSFSIRESSNISKKKRLVKEASNFIESGYTIFIDSSTTLFSIIPYLNNYKNLLIVTNGLKAALEISSRTSHRVIILGGSVLQNSNSSLGGVTARQLEHFHFNLALISCTGFSLEFGFSESSYENAVIKKIALINAAKRICIFDESKVNVRKAFKTCDVSFMDVIVVQPEFDDSIAKEVERLGPTVVRYQKN